MYHSKNMANLKPCLKKTTLYLEKMSNLPKEQYKEHQCTLYPDSPINSIYSSSALLFQCSLSLFKYTHI